jgi:intein/homing endonuclease
MVRELERGDAVSRAGEDATNNPVTFPVSQFPENAPAANPVFFRTYSRKFDDRRESWPQVCDRTIQGLAKLGNLSPEEIELLYRMQSQIKSLPSGRWLWVGGSEWLEKPENFSGAYNCTSTNVADWRAFGLMMDLAMMGCGTGAVLELQYISQLPPIRNRLSVSVTGEIGLTPAVDRRQLTEVQISGNQVKLWVGDSRQGWVKSYQTLLELSTDDRFEGEVQVVIDLSDVRPAGEPLRGFGGVANPIRLPALYQGCTAILNKAIGRQLTSVECCLLIDEAAVTIVAGNIRRCIAYGARVSAISGMKPIQDIQVGDLVLTSSGEYRPVVNKFVQGVQEVVEIRTSATSIRCTANHRVAVYDGLCSYTWKYACELQPGDRLISVPHLKGLPCSTTDWAWLVGFFIGDGHADLASVKRRNGGGGQVSFALSTQRLHGALGQKILRILSSMGYNPIVCIQKTNGRINVYRKELAEALVQYKQPWQTPVIPEFVWQGDREIRAAFLAGLSDADGTPSRNVLVNSNKLEFLREIQKLALSLGIATTLHERQPKILKGREKIYEGCHWIHICGLHSQAITVALVNQFAIRDGFTLRQGKKNGLSLPYQFVKELAATGWKPATLCRADVFWTDPKGRPGYFRDANFDSLLAEDLVNSHWLPMRVQFVAPAGQAETFDIEVEGDHEFIAEGLLVHNSAGMRQFNSDDQLGATAKDNLWQQDEHGNWRIDPERDALRMANHTRVFHRQPTLEECVEAVRKQYYSGEGAIQWAGEAIARGSSDLLSTPELKADFINAYGQGLGQQWLQQHHPQMSADELAHRLGRYGLNPCITADTWIHTGDGPRQVKGLIGKQHSTYINGELFSTTPEGFFYTGTKPVVKLSTKEGYKLRLTPNHLVLRLTAQTLKNQYSEWVEVAELQPGDRVLLHNHRHLQPWEGAGTWEEGWLLGSLIGGRGRIQEFRSSEVQNTGVQEFRSSRGKHSKFCILDSEVQEFRSSRGKHSEFCILDSEFWLSNLAARFGISQKHQTITPALEQTSYDFYRGFLRGLFDADGNVQGIRHHGMRISLPQSDVSFLEAVQRMLHRLGIVASIQQNRRPAGIRLTIESNQELAVYFCKAQHELAIAHDNVGVFREIIGFQEPTKAKRLHTSSPCDQLHLPSESFAVTVAAISPDGVEAVYDCTVPGPARFDANGFVAHNCGEILGENFHCVSGDTLLITRDGLHRIQDLVGQTVEIWNGKCWSAVIPVQTGRNRPLYRVRFADGTYLDVTEQHRFFVNDRFGKDYVEVTTAELSDRLKTSQYPLHTEAFEIDYREGQFIDPVQAYTLGQLVGDGSVCRANGKPQLQLRLYGMKSDQTLTLAGSTSGKLCYYTETKQTPYLLYVGFQKQFDPIQVRALKDTAAAFDEIATWNREAILHFIAGLADADGSAVPSGGIRIYLSEYDRAYRLYLLLLKCRIRASINRAALAGQVTNLGVRRKDLWYLQVTDCAAIPCQRLDTSRGHQPRFKGKWQVIESVEPLAGRHDTFCFNEPEFHKGVFGGTLTGQCNLSEIHLNRIDPNDLQDQEDAFRAGALSVATLLNHRFVEERYRESRHLDPIVGVSFTGLFDFFVRALGVDWLHWCREGRPPTEQGLGFKQREQAYLTRWREIVHQTVWDYCDRHGLKRPNRCTTVQPSGTKSLLTNASPGWHPPKSQRFIRRITFRKNDPVALACIDFGYNVVPSQSDKDENGNLLNDPFDPNVTEWLVEIPVAVPWADLPGADQVDVSQFSALAQMDLYMQVQKHYVTHNTSATIELREAEVEALGTRIHEAIHTNEGYISAALLARFDDHQTFPRLPFEPIDRETYERLMQEVKQRRKTDNFYAALSFYDSGYLQEAGPAGCDSDKCLLPEQKPTS